MTGQPPPTAPEPSPDASTPDTPSLEATLHAAGFPVDLLTDEQRLVLGELTPEELTLLLDVKSRLDAVGPEVQAHGEIAGGALF
ncbi:MULTISPECIES: aroma-sacti cluster domain-containing protein [unclassified Streptomyces]|uniref:aroma-sacti cluster domain-containing protein n=1 Tax=Streptomyces TaxID=1883 RepID=UPI001F0C3F30|nr:MULTISPECIES: aroma-sacti cluster domain-containing protein [unclassified Streptomyces]